jgi:hypothetical protein
MLLYNIFAHTLQLLHFLSDMSRVKHNNNKVRVNLRDYLDHNLKFDRSRNNLGGSA